VEWEEGLITQGGTTLGPHLPGLRRKGFFNVRVQIGSSRGGRGESIRRIILAYVVGKSNLKAENIFIEYSNLNYSSKFLLCSDGFWEKIDIDKNIFNMPFNSLKEQIYSKIPTDNVTVIRFFPKYTRGSRPSLVDNRESGGGYFSNRKSRASKEDNRNIKKA